MFFFPLYFPIRTNLGPKPFPAGKSRFGNPPEIVFFFFLCFFFFLIFVFFFFSFTGRELNCWLQKTMFWSKKSPYPWRWLFHQKRSFLQFEISRVLEWKNMKRNESQRKTNTKNKEKENKGPKPPETAQKIDFRCKSLGIQNWVFEICWVSSQFRNISRDWGIRDSYRTFFFPWPDPQVVAHMTCCCCWFMEKRSLAARKKTHPLDSSRRASEHQCLSEAKIPSLWHNFNISTFTSMLVSAWDPRSSTVVLLCLLLLWVVLRFSLFFSVVLPSFPSFGWCFPPPAPFGPVFFFIFWEPLNWTEPNLSWPNWSQFL